MRVCYRRYETGNAALHSAFFFFFFLLILGCDCNIITVRGSSDDDRSSYNKADVCYYLLHTYDYSLSELLSDAPRAGFMKSKIRDRFWDCYNMFRWNYVSIGCKKYRFCNFINSILQILNKNLIFLFLNIYETYFS